jgi:AraC family transcriptional regulator, transcriptional activator of pobA
MIMNIPENTEDFQKCEFDWMPESISKEIGQFNVYRYESQAGDTIKHIPYMRPGFYKIILMIGNGIIQQKSLVFFNPRITCKREYNGGIPGGYYCTFSPDFFHQYENFNQYEVFQPNGKNVFDLSEEQANRLTGYYECMIKEIDSNYLFKFDVLRNLVFEVLHFAMKNLTI